MITVDLEHNVVSIVEGERKESYAIGTPEAFALISQVWLRVGWDNKYVYTFTWMGRPIIQLPEDMMRLQEVIYQVKPDVIIETGIAHGGSLIFYGSLCKAMGRGRVIGVDVEIRPHNRQALESHEIYPYLTLIEGSSIDHSVFDRVRSLVAPGEKVMVFLDSNHTKQHVLAELSAYSTLVTKGSYIVAMDGVMEQLVGAPRTQADWIWNNPRQAALEFVQANTDFLIEQPDFLFNESLLTHPVTYCPDAFIKRIN
jgi:cephalosporin hydroxylase